MKYLLKKKVIIPVFIVTTIILITTIMIVKNNNRPYIDKVLSTSAYSYLPYEAKNYIKSTYEKTGELILTEKNKEFLSFHFIGDI